MITPHINPLTRAIFSALPALLLVQPLSASANTLFYGNHWVRDYLDFGQNKGVFKPGATGVTLQGKDGSILKLPDLPIPDFSAAEIFGACSSLGGAYGLTVKHNNLQGGSILKPQYGHTVYQKVDHHLTADKKDIAYLRYNKFVVETTGFDEGADFSLTLEEAKKRYGTAIDEHGNEVILVYRVGNGTAFLSDGKNKDKFLEPYDRDFQTAGIYKNVHGWGTPYFAEFYPNKGNSFINNVTQGDSGSLAIVYDKVKQKWVMFGTTAFLIDTYYGATLFDNKEFAAYKAKWSQDIALNGGTLTFDPNAQAFRIDQGQSTTFRGDLMPEDRQNDKDLVLSGGGTITLTENVDLGNGGLIFDEKQHYTINATQGGITPTLSGAGLNVGADTTVDWHVSGVEKNNLHQIGKGTVNYNVGQNNQLRIGNGTAVLNAEKTFNLIYLANGLGTVKLNHKNALNLDGDMNNLIFTECGGTIDMNGHNLAFKKIAASDEGAVFTNTSEKRSTLSINNTDGRYQFHGQLKGNLNLTHRYDAPTSTNASSAVIHKTHLVLDGGVDIKGNIEVANAALTLQGLPTTHALYRDDRTGKKDYTDRLDKYEGDAVENTGKDYYAKNQPAAFNQPDWETRLFKFGTLKLDQATLDIGRNTIIQGNIDAKGSTVNLGGNVQLYIDKYITKNITTEANNDIFGFRQELIEGTSVANDTIFFEGNIKAHNSSFNAYLHQMKASFELDNSSFRGEDIQLTQLLDDGISLKNGSTLKLGDVMVSDQEKVVSIEKDASSTLSMHRLYAQKGHIKIHNSDTQINALYAGGNGIIELPHWTMNEENTVLMHGSELRANTLTTEGLTRIGGALTVGKALSLTSLDPTNPYSSLAIVGLGAQKLTLGTDAKISAAFSDDYLATGNYTYDRQYTLVTTTEGIEDQRSDRTIDFKLEGKLPQVKYEQSSHDITFVIKKEAASEQASNITNAFLNSTDPRKANVFNAILQHNSNGGNKFLEVAIDSALSHDSVSSGVASLESTIAKADKMLNDFANTNIVKPMMLPIRQGIDSRLMSLRQVAYQTSPSDYPLASALGDVSMIGRAMALDAAHESVFVDVGGSLMKDDGLHLRSISTSVGYDKILRTNTGTKVVAGGMLTVSELSQRDQSNNDDGRMYAMTGFAEFTMPNGFEYQTFVTAGFANMSRSFVPQTIQIGTQSFRDKTYSVVNANTLKYRLPLLGWGDYQLDIKPMATLDFSAVYGRETKTDYLKRESINDYSLDIGVGFEVEALGEHSSWSFQTVARRNVWHSLDEIGVNLSNASGFITYDVNEQTSTEISAQMMTVQRFNRAWQLEASIGATAVTTGALGVNGNARLRWVF